AMMLRHIGEGKSANAIEQAVLVTLESGVRSADMAGSGKAASTTEFTDAVISNLGKVSETSGARDFQAVRLPERETEVAATPVETRKVTGVDIFVESKLQPEDLASELLVAIERTRFSLHAITNRGNTVYPASSRSIGLVDHYRCRFLATDRHVEISDPEILALLTRVGETVRWMHVEKLQLFNGDDGFSRTPK
ncbi:MAG: isocitrate/isopropylmalate family dehydrogenase, partial [Gemmatimonadaceae bacterium]